MCMKVVIACGYFDWFSGYQEIGLAESLRKIARVSVVAGDRVNPIFSDAHLRSIAHARRYRPGRTRERGIIITRVRTAEVRSMMWSSNYRDAVDFEAPDMLIQVMPGTLLSGLASVGESQTPTAVLYGDNEKMWAQLSPMAKRLKWSLFAATKGRLYRFVNNRANEVYGYTPEVLTRLKSFAPGKSMKIAPLSFSPRQFRFDSDLRNSTRRSLGYNENTVAVLAAGKIQRQKRLDITAAAVGRASALGIDARLLVVGDDDSQLSRSEIDRARAMPNMENRVTTVGFADSARLNAIFNASDVGVWPTMPAITIQQSMGTGLAVTLPNNDQVSHLLRPGAGSYFNPNQDESQIIDNIVDTFPKVAEESSQRFRRARLNDWLNSDSLSRNIMRDLVGEQFDNQF